MRFLLDTHAFVWAIGAPDRLSQRARAVISDSSNELLVSAVTAFEIATKHRLGKFPEAASLLLSYERTVEALGARELPISSHHGLVAGQMVWSHRDPFDRILAAQSVTEQFPLITSDAAFATLDGVTTVWA